MELKGQWFKLPDEWQVTAKSMAALERVSISKWIADAVHLKIIDRALAKGVQNENKKPETSEL